MEKKFRLLIIFILFSILLLVSASLMKNQVGATCYEDCNGACEVCDDRGALENKCRRCGGGGFTWGECANNTQCGSGCCNGGQCGDCEAGAGNCPAGQSLQHGPVQQETCIDVAQIQQCIDVFPSMFGSACGLAGFSGRCQLNYACCPYGTVSAWGGTYDTAAWSYAVGDNNQGGLGPSYRSHCNTDNDAYLSSTTLPPAWWWNPATESYWTTKYNTCRTASCVVPAPITPSGSCPAPGTSASLSWVGDAGIFEVRLDDWSNGFTFGCLSPDQCTDINGNAWAPSTTQGHSYAWEVRARTSAGLTSEWVRGNDFTCPAPTCTYQNCPSYCGYAGGTAQNTDCSYRTCAATAACPVTPTASCSISYGGNSNVTQIPYGGNPGISINYTNAYDCFVGNDGDVIQSLSFYGSSGSAGPYYPGVQTTAGSHSGQVLCFNESYSVNTGVQACPYTVSAPVPSCSGVSLSGLSPIQIGDSEIMTATPLNVQNGTVTSITYTPVTPSGVVNITPYFGIYQSWVTGVSANTATITANAIMDGAVRCSGTGTVAVTTAAPWWQVEGGNVHANSGNVSSTIPGSCSGSCLPYLITRQGGLASGATGLASSTTGIVDVGEGSLSQDGNNWEARTEYKGLTTDFAYFKRTLSNDPAGILDWTDGNLPADSGVYLAADSVITSGTWNVLAGEKKVLLVEGSVTIANNINVAQGGFLAIIASGNIIISPSVTNVEGVFISDGVINTGAGTSQLTGEGIFTGWGGFSLGRDLADPADQTQAAEKFIYRPDLQANAYRYLLRQGLSWQEVNP